MAERSHDCHWSFAILGVAWFSGTAFMLASMWRGVVVLHQDNLTAYIVLLSCIQAACAWAYFGVRAQRRASTDEDTRAEIAGR
jgi:hypothetical protein